MSMRAAVDPGTRRLGWAIGPARPIKTESRVLQWGRCEIKTGSWLDRCDRMLSAFIDSPPFKEWDLAEVVIEMPRSWDTGKGVGAKAQGSILKLMFFVGRLAQELLADGVERIGLLGAGIWQGQLPKKIIYNRMKKRYLLNFAFDDQHSDISDAIGLLHYSYEMEDKIQWIV